MTGQPTPQTDTAPTSRLPTDLDELRDRPDVGRCDHTFVHDDADHCEADAAGRVIVGVTRDDGAVLVLEHEEAPYPVLPNDTVEHGDEWADVARDAAAESAGAPVELDGPVRVRDVEHVLEGEDEPHSETTHVVLRATLASAVDDSPFPDDCDWTAHWLDEFPETMVEEATPPVEDVRLLFE